jgi:hypothetical protein
MSVITKSIQVDALDRFAIFDRDQPIAEPASIRPNVDIPDELPMELYEHP